MVLELAHYKLNETSGSTAYDATGNYDLENDSGTINQTGKIDKAYEYNGYNDWTGYLSETETIIDSFPFSISYWKKSSALDNYDASLADIATSAVNGSNFAGVTTGIMSDKCFVRIGNSTSGYKMHYKDINLNNDTWYHITIICTSLTNCDIYLNGNKQTLSTEGSASDVTWYGNKPFRIAMLWYGSFYHYVKGLFDDIRIYNFALNSTDVNLIYNSGNGTETELDELRIDDNFYTLSIGAEF